MGRQARGKCQETLIVLTVSTYDANFPQSIPSPIGCAESKTIYCKLIHPKSTTLNGQIAETDHRENNLLNLSSFFWLSIKNVQNFVQKRMVVTAFINFCIVHFICRSEGF